MTEAALVVEMAQDGQTGRVGNSKRPGLSLGRDWVRSGSQNGRNQPKSNIRGSSKTWRLKTTMLTANYPTNPTSRVGLTRRFPTKVYWGIKIWCQSHHELPALLYAI